MLISGESSKVPVRIYNQAKQLARDAQAIADDLFKGKIDKHDIAVLAKRYAELYVEVGKK